MEVTAITSVMVSGVTVQTEIESTRLERDVSRLQDRVSTNKLHNTHTQCQLSLHCIFNVVFIVPIKALFSISPLIVSIFMRRDFLLEMSGASDQDT